MSRLFFNMKPPLRHLGTVKPFFMEARWACRPHWASKTPLFKKTYRFSLRTNIFRNEGVYMPNGAYMKKGPTVPRWRRAAQGVFVQKDKRDTPIYSSTALITFLLMFPIIAVHLF